MLIDDKGNIWLTFGTVPDAVEPGENPIKKINVVVVDNQSKMIREESFKYYQSISSTPSVVSHKSNTWLSYPDDENVGILSLSL